MGPKMSKVFFDMPSSNRVPRPPPRVGNPLPGPTAPDAATTRRRQSTSPTGDAPCTKRGPLPGEPERGPLRKGSALGDLLGQVVVQRREELLGRLERLGLADQHRQVLRHLAGLDRLDDDLLQLVREADQLLVAVQLAAVLEA